jgi:hypothetical protein
MVHVIEDLNQSQKELRIRVATELAAGTSGGELQLESPIGLERKRKLALEELEKLSVLRKAAESDFLRARQEREIVGNAIARKRTQYEVECDRRQQAASDDMVLQHRSREAAQSE